MPKSVSCPHCGRRVCVPDAMLGQRVKCPSPGQLNHCQDIDGRYATPLPSNAKLRSS
jgi:hypothetical protein